jgi:hypothetical protein
MTIRYENYLGGVLGAASLAAVIGFYMGFTQGVDRNTALFEKQQAAELLRIQQEQLVLPARRGKAARP